jgi:hypothetical protein
MSKTIKVFFKYSDNKTGKSMMTESSILSNCYAELIEKITYVVRFELNFDRVTTLMTWGIHKLSREIYKEMPSWSAVTVVIRKKSTKGTHAQIESDLEILDCRIAKLENLLK